VLPVHAPLRTGNGSDVFVFAVIDWHFRIQRPQQIARALAAAGQRVFYVSNQFVDASSAGYAVEELDPELPLYQVRLHAGGAPPIYFATPAQATLEQLRDGLARLLQAARPARCIGLIDHVWWWPLANMLPNSLRVYDCMDHHEGFGNVPSGLLTLEDEVVREADVVITTSAWLAERLRGKRAQVALVRNACDPVHFGAPPPALHADPQGRRTIGYFGAIAEWFDVALLRSVALAHPGARVLLVGNDTVGAAAALAHCSNVEFTGEVPYAELPRYVHAFDVCLLPFKVLPLTLATNPVKVYEYLAAGKPVVAVDLPEVRQFGALVRAAGTPGDFVAAVTAALDEPQSGARIEERQHFALGQTWANRAAAVTAAIAAHQPPRVSVVVLTWNNLALTQACLASLAASDYPDLELIIVDNASTDGSRTWLREYAQAQSQAQLVLNDRNLGFAAGNNIGLARATGEFVVVLNNDTQVTPGWVRTLLRHFERNPRLGLAGPVTNNIGNEAKIDIAYDDRAQMLERAADYTLAHAGRVHPMRTSAFFCVMMRAAALREVGALCEDYGLGFFEDDDYCRRLEAAGWHIVCAEDVFVHHELSASFAKLPSAERQQLFDRNLALYESKWGKWQPHQHRAPSSATVES
jgi:GT2 family glycosyltransferase/glycosyltransferase involved in cell wall biosynthesis